MFALNTLLFTFAETTSEQATKYSQPKCNWFWLCPCANSSQVEHWCAIFLCFLDRQLTSSRMESSFHLFSLSQVQCRRGSGGVSVLHEDDFEERDQSGSLCHGWSTCYKFACSDGILLQYIGICHISLASKTCNITCFKIACFHGILCSTQGRRQRQRCQWWRLRWWQVRRRLSDLSLNKKS